MANKDTAKPWFKTKAYPTQSQFWQLFDWLRWKDDKLLISDVDGLQQALNNATSNAAAYTVQVFNAGASAGVNNNINTLLVDPPALLATLSITLPSTPTNGQLVNVSFGGTIINGTVVTALTILPNTGQSILQATTPTSMEAGETIAYRYNSSNSKWYRL